MEDMHYGRSANHEGELCGISPWCCDGVESSQKIKTIDVLCAIFIPQRGFVAPQYCCCCDSSYGGLSGRTSKRGGGGGRRERWVEDLVKKSFVRAVLGGVRYTMAFLNWH